MNLGASFFLIVYACVCSAPADRSSVDGSIGSVMVAIPTGSCAAANSNMANKSLIQQHAERVIGPGKIPDSYEPLSRASQRSMDTDGKHQTHEYDAVRDKMADAADDSHGRITRKKRMHTKTLHEERGTQPKHPSIKQNLHQKDMTERDLYSYSLLIAFAVAVFIAVMWWLKNRQKATTEDDNVLAQIVSQVDDRLKSKGDNRLDAPTSSDARFPCADETIAGLRIMWQRPPTPRAVLLLFHGAGHGAEDFFEEPGFTGLPEEHRIVAAAVALDFMVVAMSSSDRDRKVWTEVDRQKVAKACQEIVEREGLDSQIPVCALGASNGGAFALLLPLVLPLRSIVCQIMSLPEPVLHRMPTMPPVLFTYMPRDEHTAVGVAGNMDLLETKGVTVAEQRCHPLAITGTFFAERCNVNPQVSAEMAQSLYTARLIDFRGYLYDDPRRCDWRRVLRPFAEALGDTLVADRSPISEVMNVAWGMHEITSEGIERALKFCLMHIE